MFVGQWALFRVRVFLNLFISFADTIRSTVASSQYAFQHVHDDQLVPVHLDSFGYLACTG